MTIENARQQLSTSEGFAKAVTPKSALFGGGIALLAFGLFCVGMNLFQLGSASDWDWELIGMFFMDADVLEFSGRRAGRAEMWRWIYVWAPVVLIPLGVILLAVHFSTRSKSGAKLFTDFQERGWVGRQLFTGLKVQNGRAQVDLAFISHPSIPDEQFEAIVGQYAGWVQSLDKKTLKKTATAAVKAGVVQGVSAQALSPELPAEITASIAQGSGEYAVVVPPAQGGKLRVLPVKL